MRTWKLLIHLLLALLLSIGAGGVVSAKVASGPQNLVGTGYQAESVFNWLLCQGKSDRSTTGPPGCSVVTNSGPLWSSTKNKSAVENALGHWNKHKSEFPEFQNAKQYAEGTKDFLTNPPKGTLTKTNSRGDTLRYDPNTNTFGVLSENGAPRTMFRPKDGMDYWNRQ
jgi:hypothetical protein